MSSTGPTTGGIIASIPFDGTNLMLRQPFCFCCETKILCNSKGKVTTAAKHNLKKCTACQVAYYCSKECQKSDWKRHKTEFCQKVTSQRKLVASLKSNLLNERAIIPDYLKSIMDLAVMNLFQTASQFDGKWIWEEIVALLQEVMRMSHADEGHDFGLKAKFSCFILNVDDRDQDAFAFLHYQMKMEGEEAREILPLPSKPGDWIYPPLPTSVTIKEFYLWDVLEEVRPLYDDPARQIGRHYLMALWILKKKAAATIACRENTYYDFCRVLREDPAISLRLPSLPGDVVERIGSFLKGEYVSARRQMDVLNRQLDRIADLLDEGIPSLLPAFLSDNPTEHLITESGSPRHLWSFENDEDYYGRPHEAYTIAIDCKDALKSLPNIKPWLRQRYGGVN